MRKANWVEWIENDKELKRWYDNLSRGSPSTARERIRVLYRYCTHFNITPQDLVKMATDNRKNIEDQISDFVTLLEKKTKKDGTHYSGGYIENYLKAVKSWLNYNGIRLVRRIKISNSRATPTIVDEQIPSKNQLKTLFNYAPLRGKVSIALMAFSGLRPQVLGNGTKGLRIRNLPDVEIKDKTVMFKATPIQVIVPAELSKTKHRYITFLNEEGMDYLKSYLEKRLANGEKCKQDSPVITVSPGGFEKGGKKKGSSKYGSPFVGTGSITKEIRTSMRPRFTWRPYVLRAYFDTQLLLAESQGKISHAYRQFIMGHKGDIEARYTTDKKLPQDVIEDIRRVYKACEPFLVTQVQEVDKSEIKKMLLKQWQQQAEMYNINLMEIKIQKEKELGEVDLDEEIKAIQQEIVKVTAPQLQPPGTTYQNNSGREHKIVNEKQLVKHLNEGWELVKEINGGKYLIRKS